MQRFLQSGYRAAVARDGDAVVGYLLWREEDDGIFLRQFFVVRRWRRRGLGRAMVEQATREYWAGRTVCLEVLAANRGGREFWTKLGFGEQHTRMSRGSDEETQRTEHRMEAYDVTAIVGALEDAGVHPCVGGGWAVDALVGEQTRTHADLDLWVPAAELDRLITAFAARRLDRLLPWGGDRPWNMVLHDGGRLRVDLHLYEPRPDGDLHYGSALDGQTFPALALSGSGRIGGRSVRCDHPEWSLRWHTGYPPRAVDHHDVAQLCRRFGLEPPAEFRPLPGPARH